MGGGGAEWMRNLFWLTRSVRRIVLDEMPATPPRTLRVEQLADLAERRESLTEDRLEQLADQLEPMFRRQVPRLN